MTTGSKLAFVKEDGFPRCWSAIRRIGGTTVAVIIQEHERSNHGKSVFRYRATLLPDRQLGLFTTLRRAKQAITDALA